MSETAITISLLALVAVIVILSVHGFCFGNPSRKFHKRIDDISAVYFIISIRQVFFLFKIDKNSYMFLCYLLIFTIALAFCVCW